MTDLISTPLLDKIHSPKDLRELDESDLPRVCSEIREYVIDSVSRTAGHLASGLAVVELTTALHYVFNTPDDKIIFDVGHQSYPHKILTGHKEELKTIRKKDGLHAFVYRGETEYDVLTTGHASTSVGSALGLAVANRNRHSENKVVAVIGDGALSGGAAYEGLNCAGSVKDVDLIVILNDNEMSISENVGSVASYLSSILASPYYVKLINGGKKVLEKLPAIQQLALKAQEHVKGMVMPGTLFEELGFNYIGPIDGHDVNNLVSILHNVKKIGGLQFVHVVTKKGKGYEPAENNPTLYHGVPVFDPDTGEFIKCENRKVCSFSDNFGKWLCDRAFSDDKLVGITPAMPVGSGMVSFSKEYPQQFFDVGIAEQHAFIFASGLAAGGMHPVIAIYSTFLQRAYDGLIHDLAIQNLPVVVAIDRGGIVGPDGPTHQGMFDIAFMRCIPNLIIMTPSSLNEQYLLLNTAYKSMKPCVVRYERASLEVEEEKIPLSATVEIGRAKVLRQGKKVALCCFGSIVSKLKDLSDRYDLTLVDMRFVKPLDVHLSIQIATTQEAVISIEDGEVLCGNGQEVYFTVKQANEKVRVELLGLKDEFIMEGSRDELLSEQGLDAASVEKLLLDIGI